MLRILIRRCCAVQPLCRRIAITRLSIEKTKKKRPAGNRPTVTPSVELPPANLSRKRPTALYQQVKEYILAQIQSGKWPPETRVPSENRLIQALGASKMTVNRALRELTAEGVLHRSQGVGTFVAARRPAATLLEIKPIAEEITQQGGRHSCRVHLTAREPAAPDLAMAMALPPGAEVFHALIVHADNRRPIQLEDRYVNPAVAPAFLEQDFQGITPSRYLLDTVPVSEVEHVVEAILPDEQTQELLAIEPGEPCIVLYRRTWTDNLVVTRCRFIHPGSRYRIGGRFQPTLPHQATEA